MKFAEIDHFLHSVTPKRNRVLSEMERYARRHGFPIIGPLVGRLLFQMATATKARRILELGSGYGYSAFWFALAIGKRGHITLSDLDPANRERALQYFRKGDLEAGFRFHLGDALEIAAGLKGPFDIILNDIDKEDYPATIDVAARLLRPGGLFLTDNVLWSGRVYDIHDTEPATMGVRRFVKRLYADRRFFTTIIPLRDGLAMAVRV